MPTPRHGGDLSRLTAPPRHAAVCYRDPDELLAGTRAFVVDGLAAGEPVLVAAPARTLELLRARLRLPDRQVSMVDMRQAGRNPGAIIPQVLLRFATEHPGRRVRILGEPVWAGRTDEEYPACVQHEALINTVFAGRDAYIWCLYDAAGLAPDRLADAARTHPWIGTGGQVWPSRHYQDPAATTAEFNPPLPEPPAGAVRLVVRTGTLGQLRQVAIAQAAAAGLPTGRVGDLTIALNELVTNSIQYGGGAAHAAIWVAGDWVIGQVSDAGHITDPLAGRIPPAPGHPAGGRGLVVVNALCDLVRVHTRPGRTTIRVQLHR